MAQVSMSDMMGSTSRLLTIEIEKQFSVEAEHSAIRKAIESSAQIVADKWLEENRDKILERLNVDAIANMIMLEVATQTKNDILKKEN